jgi:hypothetical protein
LANGKFNGKSTTTWANGNRFEGYYTNHKVIIGKYFYPDGSWTSSSQFSNNYQINGSGECWNAAIKRKLVGTFSNGIFRDGTMYDEVGNVYSVFKNGEEFFKNPPVQKTKELIVINKGGEVLTNSSTRYEYRYDYELTVDDVSIGILNLHYNRTFGRFSCWGIDRPVYGKGSYCEDNWYKIYEDLPVTAILLKVISSIQENCEGYKNVVVRYK